MGLIAHVFRWTLGDCTNGGITSKHDKVCLINVYGPFTPDEQYPAMVLDAGPLGHPIIRPADENGNPIRGGMMGGNYVACSDSRFGEAIRRQFGEHYGNVAIPVHDRYETPEQQRLYST